MADNQQQQPTSNKEEQQIDLGKVAITPEQIAKVKAMQKQFDDAIKTADSEFLLSMYTRLYRALTPSLLKISKAEINIERKKSVQAAKNRRDSLKGNKK